jgi:hypothetical protein
MKCPRHGHVLKRIIKDPKKQPICRIVDSGIGMSWSIIINKQCDIPFWKIETHYAII